MHRVDLGGVEVGALDRAAWRARLVAAARGDRLHHHVSLNAAKWVAMRRDRSLREAVRSADSIAADGAGIVLASRWLRRTVPERVAGFDLAVDLLAEPAIRVYLLGAKPAVVARVAGDLRARGVDVAGARDGYFAPDDERTIAEAVGEARANLVLVALGTPAAELFVHRWRPLLGAGLAMGVGGTFDVLAGVARRAPDLVGRVGLEWAWRLVESPQLRFRRAVVDSARFAVHVGLGHRVDP
jgi:N-acetylglucosaminyldiphosphoundecaprenol N-acetyl-beta-D-mannosaminyltransferase